MMIRHLLCLSCTVFLISCSSIDPSEDFKQLSRDTYRKNHNHIIWKNTATNKNIAKTKTQQLLQGNFNLDKAVRIGLINNPALQAEYESLGVSVADIFSASRIPNPGFESTVYFPVNSAAPSGSSADTTLMISATDLIKLRTKKKLAKTEHEKVMIKLKATISETIKQIKESYYTYLFAQAEIDTKAQQIRLQTRYIQELKKHVQSGLENEIEIFEGKTELHDLRLERAKLLQKKEEAYLDLLQHMGLDPMKIHLSITDNFLPPRMLNIDKISLWRKVKQHNSAIKIACLDVIKAEQNINLTKADLFGDVNVGAEFERSPENERTIGPKINLMLPLFNQNQGEVARARYEFEQAKKTLHATEHDIKFTLLKTLNNIQHTQDMISIYQKNISKTQDQSTILLNELGKKMQVSQLKIIETKRNAMHLKSKYLEIVHELWINRAELETLY